MTKPTFRPIAPLDVDDAALERVNESLGVPTLVRPGTGAAQSSAARPSPKPTPQEKLTVEITAYLMDAVRHRALERRMSIRHLVMLALKGVGLTVEPGDLVPDARRAKPRNP